MKQFITLIAVILALHHRCFAQDNTTVYSNHQITIQTERKVCADERNGIEKEFVMLSITNSSASELHIQAKKEIWYDGSCRTCGNDSQEFYLNISVPAGSTLQGSCDASTDQLRVFASMPNVPKARTLSHFELGQIQITEN